MDVVCNELFDKLLDVITTKNIDIGSALDLVRISMELVDKSNIPGPDKAKAVISALTKLVDEKYDTLKAFVPVVVLDNAKVLIDSGLVQPTIDIIVEAARGKLDINKTVGCVTGCLGKLFKK